jgi:tetratricopeptide (TPR) repeat protein
MGEVHRARDTKLNRDVALKVLPREFALEPNRLARFKLEAQVLASLNHPNVAAIYGFEESDGVQALVLELVEGPTLADRIAKSPLPIHEALAVARQIADALEAAHKQGVIHRDLKPPNIKLRPDGMVKVLDFGLAKLVPASGFELQSSNLSQLPTITSPATARGVIMGTAAYMSPEQARGTPVDKQTDIWGFGAVFFEMLSGRPAFSGGTFSDIIAKILEREPEWQALPASTPGRIRDLLGRCLQRDQHRRLHDIADARIEIEEAQTALRGRVRRMALPAIAAAVALAIGSMVGAWWYASRLVPSTQHEPVSVVITDFENRTKDPTFDRTLEPMLKLALEGAAFISAYDRSVISRALGVEPPVPLDEQAAQQLAVKQGLGLVVSGVVAPQGAGFKLSMKASHAVTGNVIAEVSDTASSKDQVLSVATGLASAIREALGDETPESDRRFAMETLSATSLDVVRDYAAAALAMSNAAFDEAFDHFSRAAARDPNFGLAHAGMAIASRNLDRQQEAVKYIKEAVSHLDGMTERERYRTRGLFYLITGDSQQCVKEFGDLVARYAADVSARNNLALCLTFLRDLPRAVDQMQQVVKILPNRALYRENLALYAAYSGNFTMAEQQARAIDNPSWVGLLALAFAQMGQNQLAQAAATYQAIGKKGGLGPSYQASGLGDLALYEGRFADAARIFAEAAAADLAAKNTDRAANKFAALAYTQLLRRQPAAAIAAADEALAYSNAVSIRFLAARVFIEAGEAARVRVLAGGLGKEPLAQPQTYGKILEGQMASKNGDALQAIKLLTEANTLLDTWIGHFDLGRAYLEAGLFTQADSEFDRCLLRRGETLALFLEEEPTYGYFPSVYYYQGRAREGLKSVEFVDAYRIYLRIREEAGEDPLLGEVRRRAGP